MLIQKIDIATGEEHLGKVQADEIADGVISATSDVLQTITLSANTTYNKSSLTGNILFLNTNNTTTRTFTVGTGFVANDKLTFIIDTNSLGLINISINSRSISNNRGSILSFIFNGTNWISTNVYGWDLSTTNLANTIYGFNNQSRVNNQNTVIYGNGNRNDGESVVLGTNNSETSQNSGVITGKYNTSSGGFNYTYGLNNQITGGGTYNFTAGFDNRNTNGKSYTNTFGHGARVLHNGEIVYKIDNVTNFASSGYNSHLRIVNFGTITTNATSTEIFLNDSSTAINSHRLVIPPKSSYAIKGRMSAVQNDFSDIKHWEFNCVLLRDGSNNTSLQGTTNITVLQESTGATTWDIAIGANNTDEALKIDVFGDLGQTIYWKGILEIIDMMLP